MLTQQMEISGLSTLPEINHSKMGILEKAKEQWKIFSILGKESALCSAESWLFLYTCELLKHYKEKLSDERDAQKIFDFLSALALNDLQKLGFPVISDMFQDSGSDGMTLKDEILFFI